jgi:hypothetical protein
MGRAKAAGSLLVVGAMLAAGSLAWAAGDEPSAWRVTVTPYLWAAGLSGDVTARGTTASPDASLLDILEATDSLIGLQGHVDVMRGPLGGFADVLYLKLRVEDVGATGIDLENRVWYVEFGLQYRLLDRRDEEGRGIALDAYAGGRYSYLELDLDTRGAPSLNQSQSWVDPIVGAQVHVGLGEHVFLLVRGDIGGFGVGSDFAWSATGLVGFRWRGAGLEWALLAGYKALSQDYSTGSGRQQFRWDTTMHGPVVGLSIRF